MANSATHGSQNVAPATTATPAGLAHNIAGALCYAVGILSGIVFLALAPYNQNRRIRFHAFQAILFSVSAMLVSMAFSIAGIVLSALIGAAFGMVTMVAMLGICGVWLFLIWKAYQGEKLMLPVIGALAQQFAER